jgi:hypothetical protein
VLLCIRISVTIFGGFINTSRIYGTKCAAVYANHITLSINNKSHMRALENSGPVLIVQQLGMTINLGI